MGIVLVACLAGRVAVGPPVTITVDLETHELGRKVRVVDLDFPFCRSVLDGDVFHLRRSQARAVPGGMPRYGPMIAEGCAAVD